MQQLEMLEKTDERRCCVCKEVKNAEEFTYHKNKADKHSAKSAEKS